MKNTDTAIIEMKDQIEKLVKYADKLYVYASMPAEDKSGTQIASAKKLLKDLYSKNLIQMREKDELDHDIEPTPIAGEGEIEIEYAKTFTENDIWISADLKCTISYKYWSIDVESVDAEYKFIGSVNYLPSDFEQLIRDYLHDMPELKGIRVNQLTKI